MHGVGHENSFCQFSITMIMREFFKGWRRKTGLVTLVLACMVMGIWLRSRLVVDQITFARGNALQILNSDNGTFVWLAIEMTADEIRAIRFVWQSGPTKSFDKVEQSEDDTKLVREWKFCGFSFGEGPFATNGQSLRLKYLGIFYSSITIPLAVISAWIILTPLKKQVIRRTSD